MSFKLAFKNIVKSIKDYSIYFFTLVIAVAIFYIFNSMDAQQSMLSLSSYKHDMARTLVMLVGYVSIFVSVILGFLIIYSNNFLIKRRKKELGLYLTLGMSRQKVSFILVLETLIVGIISLVVGLVIGVLLSQFISIFVAKLFEADLTNFEFIFSKSSLLKTILYFGIIFILVIVFNVFTLSRYKLIDLLNAHKQNEKVKIKNKYLMITVFILSLVFLGYAYYLLFNNVLFSLNNEVIVMLVCGAIGTFLFFLSVSSFFLKVFQIAKKVYYKGLNMFVLKQINNKINTSVVSTTIICLMLLLTIGILSGSFSLANAFNSDLKDNNLTDFTLYSNYAIYDGVGFDFEKINFSELVNKDDFNNYVDTYYYFTKYTIDSITIKDLITENKVNELKKEYGDSVNIEGNVPIILESDYQKLMKFLAQDFIEIDDDEYLVLANVNQVIEYYSDSIKNNKKLVINKDYLNPAIDYIVETAITNYNGAGNDGIIVVSDKFKDYLTEYESIMIGNYNDSGNSLKLEEDFINYLDNNDINSKLLRTRYQMESTSVGIKVITTFIGLYLGIIFAISSATVLAISQLSSASDNKERYHVLRLIGSDEKLINRSLFIQIFVSFMLPFVVALFHSYFGLRELNSIIQLTGNINLSANIFLTTLFIVIVYGGYFLATFLCSKQVIKES